MMCLCIAPTTLGMRVWGVWGAELRLRALMGWDGMGWDGVSWLELRVRRDGMGWDRTGDGVEWDGWMKG